MTPLVVENEPPVTFLRRKMTGGRFSKGVVIRRYTGTATVPWKNGCQFFSYVPSCRKHLKCKYYLSDTDRRAFMAGVASQAGDADSSRVPGLTSALQGSLNVHPGALLLVPQ